MAEKLTNEQIIDTLKQMSALELSALVKDVEKEFGVTAAAPVAAAAACPATLKEKISPVEADTHKKALTDIGAEVEIK